MPVRRWMPLASLLAAAACAGVTSRTDVRKPLGAYLTPGATTGAVAPLRFDTTAAARVVPRSTAASLPPASYAPAQAARGEALYQRRCTRCHEESEFVGQKFVEQWNDRRVNDLYRLIRSTMPLNDPGGLKDDEYLGIVAYLLQANHAAAGPDSLAADTTMLRSRRIAVRLP